MIERLNTIQFTCAHLAPELDRKATIATDRQMRYSEGKQFIISSNALPEVFCSVQ
jgi:hypothetical protein